VAAVLAGHEDDPRDSALALRLMGAVHRLVLERAAPELARHYPSAGGTQGIDGAWEAFAAVVEREAGPLRELVERPVQTNEVGRCAALLGGFLTIARDTGLPLRLLELGTSAGLNLRWDHYRYVGDGGAAWGDPDSPVRLEGHFAGPLPAAHGRVAIGERHGCDSAPLDPATREGRLTLTAYTWPDQTARLARLAGAIEVARRVPAALDLADVANWLPARLAEERAGAATVVFHSIVWQYLDAERRERIRAALSEAGAAAGAGVPLAWLRMEPASGAHTEVTLTTWPGGRERIVATAGAHGHDVIWRAPRV
jgi:hypothetical protein